MTIMGLERLPIPMQRDIVCQRPLTFTKPKTCYL